MFSNEQQRQHLVLFDTCATSFLLFVLSSPESIPIDLGRPLGGMCAPPEGEPCMCILLAVFSYIFIPSAGNDQVPPPTLPLPPRPFLRPLRCSMFLTTEQRRRKEAIKTDQARKRKAIESANKLLSDRAQRDAWAQSASCSVAGEHRSTPHAGG